MQNQSVGKQEKATLLRRRNSVEDDIELNMFIGSESESDMEIDSKIKLLKDEGNTEVLSISSLAEDEPTFSSSQLMLTDVSEHGLVSYNNDFKKLSKTSNLNTSFQITPAPANTTDNLYGERFVDKHVRQVIESETSNETYLSAAQETGERDVSNTNNETNVTELLELSVIPGNEDSQLLHKSNDDASHPEEPIEEDEEVLEVFSGSLGIDMAETIWLLDIDRVVDIQLGENEWGTDIYNVEGGLSYGGWETTISEIQKNEEIAADWNTSIQEISDDQELQEEWNTTIAEQFQNKEVPLDWGTTFNKMEIKTMGEGKNRWSTIFRKIKPHVPTATEWRSTFNTIEKTVSNKPEWKSKFNKTFTNDKSTDWNCRFNKIGGADSSTDPWENKLTEMILKSDDRATHWETKFLDISENSDELNPWTTDFKDISTEEEEDDVWNTSFIEISDEQDLPEDWVAKFLDIEKHEPLENEWLITMQNIPDSYREDADWSTAFKIIECHEGNLLWDTTFNTIIPMSHESLLWENTFFTTDISDMERDTWETSYNKILPTENTQYDWQVFDNPIEFQE